MSDFPRRRHLRVQDVMTTNVVTAHPSDSFKEIARRLYENRLGALPVIDDDRQVVGVVSEGDLLVKQGGNQVARLLHPRQTRLLARKGKAVVAAEVMSEPAVTISAEATVAEAARVMNKHDLKRLPVVDDEGQLVGVVSSHDLIKVFVRSDDSIRDEVIDGVLGRDLLIDMTDVRVNVRSGVVVIDGQIERRTELPMITHLVSAIDGVVAVDNALSYRWDDTHVAYAGEVPRGAGRI